MRQYILSSSYCLLITSLLNSDVYNGLILYSNSQGVGPSNTYIINNSFNNVNVWNHSIGAIGIPHLNPDRSIIQQFRSNEPYFGNTHGPVGGILKKIDWDGNELWSHSFFSNQFQPHHDIEVLPNGNILIIAWEKKSYQDAISAGRVDVINEMWPLVIFEIEPSGAHDAIVVWEWHLWDHLIQDIDSNLIRWPDI